MVQVTLSRNQPLYGSIDIAHTLYSSSDIVYLTQGNHVAFAATLLLEEYQVPKKYIKGIENAVKPKKQK